MNEANRIETNRLWSEFSEMNIVPYKYCTSEMKRQDMKNSQFTYPTIIHVRIHVYVFVHVDLDVNVHVHAHVYERAHVHVHVHAHIRIHVRVHVSILVHPHLPLYVQYRTPGLYLNTPRELQD